MKAKFLSLIVLGCVLVGNVTAVFAHITEDPLQDVTKEELYLENLQLKSQLLQYQVQLKNYQVPNPIPLKTLQTYQGTIR